MMSLSAAPTKRRPSATSISATRASCESLLHTRSFQTVHALPPSVFTLYELTKLPAALLRETLNDGSINAKLERKDVARWRKGEGGKVAVDGKTVERKSLREQLKAAKVEIETLEAKLKDAGGGYFDLALDSAEHIGQQLAEHMSEARFDTAVKAAKARFKAKRQKPAG